MKQYRKKPVIIEAVQFDGLNPTEIKDFVGENCEVEIYDNKVTPPVARIVIHTLEGNMEVSKGDYVIKGVKGEFYPCKPDIFQQTYESAETQKELEEAANKFAVSYDQGTCDGIAQDCFIAGAEWQKEQDNYDTIFYKGMMYYRKQMMGEGISTTVLDFSLQGNHPHINIPLSHLKFHSGENVRVIILKDDDNR